MALFLCQRCGNPFSKPPSTKAKFCSWGCCFPSTPTGSKTCVSCGEQKADAEFSRNGKRLKNICKLCFAHKIKVRNSVSRASAPHPYKIFTDGQGNKHRKCSLCQIVKGIVFFPPAPSGCRSQCRECKNAKARDVRSSNPERFRQKDKLRYTRNPLVRENQQKWRKANKNKLKISQRRYRTANLDRVKAGITRWKRLNPQVVNEARSRRRAAQKFVEVEVVNRAAIIERDDSTCYLCGAILAIEKVTLDHVTPITRGGGHTYDNLKVCCGPCNFSKGDKTLSEYLLWKERLTQTLMP